MYLTRSAYVTTETAIEAEVAISSRAPGGMSVLARLNWKATSTGRWTR